MKNKVYIVKVIECDSSHNIKVFLEPFSANEYAKYLNDGFDTLYQLEEERTQYVDEFMDFLYDRNGCEDSHPFESIETWYAKKRRSLNVPQECTHWDSFATVEEVELVED